LQKPTFQAFFENIGVIFIEELRGIWRLPILLDVGHDGGVPEYVDLHILLFNRVGTWAIAVSGKVVLNRFFQLLLR